MRVKSIFGCILLAVACISYYMHGGADRSGRPDGEREQPSREKEECYVDSEVGLPVTVRSGTTSLIHHTGYSVLYDEDTHLPVWVAWTLTPDRFADVAGRYDKFLPDPSLVDPVTADEYKKSGYDRGHICPAADNKWSEQAMRESFYLTNVCPQNHNLNSGDWRELEEACREWTCQSGKLYVVGGPVLYDMKHKTIGAHRIVVPDAFYKVVLCLAPLKGAGFMYENAAGSRPMGAYAVTIDDVERLTGIDFFSALPDSVENKVEAEYAPAAWGIAPVGMTKGV